MNEGTLYERTTSQGAAVRIRRTSAGGVTPVVAVLERISGPDGAGQEGAHALVLLEVMAQTELDAILLLEPYARSEAAILRLVKTRQ